jgi:tripartite-type tricarboxylate transporter receptor subunit TctC
MHEIRRQGETMVRMLAALMAPFILASAAADAFPSKAIRILVGFPPGGPSDVPARIIAEKLRVALGQAVIVDNRTGAAGMIALNEMLAQPRDGHTLLLCSYIDTINPLLYRKVTYKLDDVAPVSLIQKAYYAFTISNELPINDLKGFIAHAKTKPGALNYGKVGAGSVTELLAKQLEKTAGITMTGVTFRGTGPAVQEIAAGRLDFMVGPLAVTIPLHEAKKVKIIGMTSPERLPIAPDVPTVKEQGVPIVNYGWWGVCAAAGTPQPILETLNRHVAAAVASAEFRTVIEKTGVIPLSSSVDEFAAIMADTAKEAGVMIKELGIQQLD